MYAGTFRACIPASSCWFSDQSFCFLCRTSQTLAGAYATVKLPKANLRLKTALCLLSFLDQPYMQRKHDAVGMRCFLVIVHQRSRLSFILSIAHVGTAGKSQVQSPSGSHHVCYTTQVLLWVLATWPWMVQHCKVWGSGLLCSTILTRLMYANSVLLKTLFDVFWSRRDGQGVLVEAK